MNINSGIWYLCNNGHENCGNSGNSSSNDGGNDDGIRGKMGHM